MTKESRRFAIISNDAFSLVNFRAPLLAEIARRGHEVFALAPDFDDHSLAVLGSIGAEPVRISMSRTGLNPVRDAADIIKLRQVLARLEPDTVLGFAIKPVIYGTLAAKAAGVPHRFALIAGLGYAFGDSARTGSVNSVVHYLARGLYTLALAMVEKVFMQNPDDVRDFEQMKIAAASQIVLVNGTGVDLSAWPVLAPVAKPVTFLLAARLLVEKGILDYVHAARLVKAKHPQTRFVLLGSIEFKPDAIARDQVEQWIEEGLVEWPGHVDVRPRLAQCSVFVLPSYYREGIPRSIQEAMASGRPVITAATPGCRETVMEGVNGFLVPPRDPEALAAAMQRFIDNPRLIVDMGRESRLLAETKFDVRKINARMIETMGL